MHRPTRETVALAEYLPVTFGSSDCRFIPDHQSSAGNSVPASLALQSRRRRTARPGSAPGAGLIGTFGLIVLLGASGCSSLRQAVQNRPCSDAGVDHVEIDLARHNLELLWKDANDKPFLTLDRARAYVEARGDSVVALTNAGIYEPGFVPTGLLVQQGIERQPLNLRDGEGNFYLKPNGVFYLSAAGARIVESSGFEGRAEEVILALQSGPLLLSRGAVHAAFNEHSSNCRLRSGIGIRPDGAIMVAISRGAISFHDFSRHFLEELGCTDALYLDGTISSLYAPAANLLRDSGNRYAGILVVTARLP